MWFLLLPMLIMQAAGVMQLPPAKSHRLPLQKKPLVLRSPIEYAKRIHHIDEKTGKPVEYDPKPRVKLLDAKSGRYALQWIGYDGKEKTILYQRPDAIDAVVTAEVSRTPSGQYLYVYSIQNLASSGQHLSGFVVQNFASDVMPAKTTGIHVGQMSKNREMKEGNWVRFGIFPDYTPVISPGRSIEFRLSAASPPGLVECRIHGGTLGMKGVGEEPPQELENVLPGYEAWPRGYTIGPVAHLTQLSQAERAQYILRLLPQFQKLGWMSTETVLEYQQSLSRSDLESAYQRAARDLKADRITTEVFAIIEGARY